MSISKRAYDISFGGKKKKSGEESTTGRRSNSNKPAELRAGNVIAVYQPRLILIWFLNPCVIKTAKREQHQEKEKKKDISQMLRPSVRVTRKVILRFE